MCCMVPRAWSARTPGSACPIASWGPARPSPPPWWGHSPTAWTFRKRCGKPRNSLGRAWLRPSAPGWARRCRTASSGCAAGTRVAPAEAGLRGLYLVTPDWIDTPRLTAAVAAALTGRPTLLQYRNKLADPVTRREQAELVLALCRTAGVPMIVNDSLELALAIGAEGLHLGRDDGDPAAARAALGPGRLLGVSCYAEFARARAVRAAGADYVAFGALFPSPTKPAAARAALDLLTRARAELDCPVAGIGGITLGNAPLAVAAGADLLAVVSDVFAAPDPAARAAAY